MSVGWLPTLLEEVPNVTNINTGELLVALWRPRPGAFSLRVGFLGTGGSVPASARGRAPSCSPFRMSGPSCSPFRSAVRSRGQLGQPNSNYMTSVNAVGVGRAGPPPDREPA